MDNRRVFAFLHERLGTGLTAVLVTIVAVEGASMRSPGTHMGVCADGSFAGSLSGGCLENAVVAEALETLAAGVPRSVRFGSGSPYIDIALPCGGGLDIHFQPFTDGALIGRCHQAIARRHPFSLRLPLTAAAPEVLHQWHPTALHQSGQYATIGHWPEPKLLIIGHGATVRALANLARQMDVTVEVLTPDDEVLRQLQTDREHSRYYTPFSEPFSARRLAIATQTEAIQTDPWTAIVFLFHDHDWEIALLAQALSQPHFYLGAMGGKKAHQWRTDALATRGWSDRQIAAIHAPIGLFHSSRDPDTLALSALAQVIDTYHHYDFTVTDA